MHKKILCSVGTRSAGQGSFLFFFFGAFYAWFAVYTPATITAAPTICQICSGSPSASAPAKIDTMVDTQMNDDVLFTPIFAIAALERKNAATEQPTP